MARPKTNGKLTIEITKGSDPGFLKTLYSYMREHNIMPLIAKMKIWVPSLLAIKEVQKHRIAKY